MVIQEKEIEVKEKFELTKEALEKALKDANDKLVNMMEEKQEAEEELKAINKKLLFTQKTLKQSEVKVHLARRKVDDVKAE